MASAGKRSPFLTSNPVAPIWRDNVQVVDRASWGRICGCAKLLAGTLRCLRLCWQLPWDWSPAEQLGRCPKPHKGAPPLDPARGRRKGTKSPLDPFFAAILGRFSLHLGLSGFLFSTQQFIQRAAIHRNRLRRAHLLTAIAPNTLLVVVFRFLPMPAVHRLLRHRARLLTHPAANALLQIHLRAVLQKRQQRHQLRQ